MTNCFSLTRKSDLQSGAVSLQQIDNEMCSRFGVVHDPNNSYHLWVNTIGLALSTGQTFGDIIQECHTSITEYPESASYYETKLKIAEYLTQHFVSDAGRRSAGNKWK
jgi:hypothetical protein